MKPCGLEKSQPDCTCCVLHKYATHHTRHGRSRKTGTVERKRRGAKRSEKNKLRALFNCYIGS